MFYIAIETSTTVCSAALLEDNKCLNEQIDYSGQNHAKLLPLFIDQILKEVKNKDIKLDAIALSQGPGSYTGLRIGTALAKGLCYGMQIPLIAIDTLQLLCANVIYSNEVSVFDNAILCPMIDARRMEVYTALFDNQLNKISGAEAKIIDETAFTEELEGHKIYFFGNGADKCRSLITHPNAIFISNIVPQAKDMGILATEAYKKQQFADVAYFDPFYLKEFQATIAKNKIF